MAWLRILIGVVAVLTAQAAWAGPGLDPREQLPDAAAEARARGLFKQLRCVVCQSESLDDSEADLARDMRHLIRTQIASGKSDADVIAHLTSRYGDFVLLSPPSRPSTWALWFGPFALLAIVLALVGWFLVRRWASSAETPLSPAEDEALTDLRRNLPPR